VVTVKAGEELILVVDVMEEPHWGSTREEVEEKAIAPMYRPNPDWLEVSTGRL
jgi:hypothetical protein